MVARNQQARKRDSASKVLGDRGGFSRRSEAEQRLVAMLGAPGRTGAAHVVQFRPVRVECGFEEAVPEALRSVGGGGPPGTVVGLDRKEG